MVRPKKPNTFQICIHLIGEDGGIMNRCLGDMGCHLMDVPFKALKLKYPTSVNVVLGKYILEWDTDYFQTDVLLPHQ